MDFRSGCLALSLIALSGCTAVAKPPTEGGHSAVRRSPAESLAGQVQLEPVNSKGYARWWLVNGSSTPIVGRAEYLGEHGFAGSFEFLGADGRWYADIPRAGHCGSVSGPSNEPLAPGGSVTLGELFYPMGGAESLCAGQHRFRVEYEGASRASVAARFDVVGLSQAQAQEAIVASQMPEFQHCADLLLPAFTTAFGCAAPPELLPLLLEVPAQTFDQALLLATEIAARADQLGRIAVELENNASGKALALAVALQSSPALWNTELSRRAFRQLMAAAMTTDAVPSAVLAALHRHRELWPAELPTRLMERLRSDAVPGAKLSIVRVMSESFERFAGLEQELLSIVVELRATSVEPELLQNLTHFEHQLREALGERTPAWDEVGEAFGQFDLSLTLNPRCDALVEGMDYIFRYARSPSFVVQHHGSTPLVSQP